MPWEKQFDVEAARERAVALFWAKGYKATSMQDLLDAMGIQRGSFYGTFGSKRDILLESLRRYDDERARAFARIRAQSGPVQAIERIFARIAERASSRKSPAGCFLVSSASELAPADREVASLVNRAFRDVESTLHGLIQDGRRAGEVSAHVDPEDTARALLGMLLGMQVLARAGAAAGVLESIQRQAMALLGAHAPPSAGRASRRQKTRGRTTN